MKCKICNDREMAHGAEQGTGLCNFCWELRSRIEVEPELARRILASVLVDRADRSPLGPLRAVIVGYISELQAQEIEEEGEEVCSMSEMLTDGLRGLAEYDDEELLREFEGVKDVDETGRSLAEQLKGFPLWKKILEDTEERKNGLENASRT